MSSCRVSWVLFGFASLGKTVGCFTFSCFVKYIVAICMLFCYIIMSYFVYTLVSWAGYVLLLWLFLDIFML